MSWWNDDYLTISAVQCKYHETSEDIFDNYVSKSGFNTEQLLHLTASGHMAHYNEERDGKKLDEYLKKSKKAGIREIVYVNIHGVTPEDHDLHPEFSLLGKNKEPLMLYNNTHYSICFSGPYFKEHIKNIKALCKHDIDGVFLDGPIMRSDACYCDHCLKRFEEVYGKSRYDADYYESCEFNMKMATEFVKATYEAIKEVNPNILLYINNTLLKPDTVGVRTRDCSDYVDVIGTEGGFVWVDKGITMWHVSPMVKMAETVSDGKPRVCFIAGDHKPWSYYMHTPCETGIFYAQSLAYGANVWYGLHGSSKQGELPGGKVATEFNGFIHENKENLLHTSSCSKVALFWSDATASRYSTSVDETDFVQNSIEISKGEKKGNQNASFKGMYDLLTRAHIQFDLIDEVSFKKGHHKKYDTIIFTTAACISDEVSEIVKDYVKEGGRLISNFDCGLYNELCERREKSSLAEIQGVKNFEDIIEYPVGCGYLINNKECDLFEDIYDEDIPMPLLSVKNEYAETAEVIGYARMPLKGRYVDLVKETYPSVVYNRYGKGESIYFSGSVGEFFDKYANTDIKKIVVNAVNKFTTPLIESDAPGSVEVSVRKKDNKYIIHLINLTGEMIRPIERIIPLYNLKFTINDDINVKSIKTLRGKEKLACSKENGSVEFTLPALNNHEIIVVEF